MLIENVTNLDVTKSRLYQLPFRESSNIEIISSPSVLTIIDHDYEVGITTSDSNTFSKIISLIIKKRTTLTGDEVQSTLTWNDTIRPGVIATEDGVYNVFTNRRGERCYTDGKQIWKSAEDVNKSATEVSKDDCLPKPLEVKTGGLDRAINSLKLFPFTRGDNKSLSDEELEKIARLRYSLSGEGDY